MAQPDEVSAGVPAPTSALPNQRLVSLDALRGFVMFWLIGGREFSLALVTCLFPALADGFETQLLHPKWRGFVAWDLVMPMFLFMVGTALPFAMAKRLERGTTLASTYRRIARRVAVLWILGLIAQLTKYPDKMVGMELYSNALQAIAVGYLVTSLALLHLRMRGQIVLLVALVLGYGALLMFVPFGGHPAGTLERTTNLARYIDERVLGIYRHQHDFTWVLTSLSFAAMVLIGAMAGHVLRARVSAGRKLVWLAAIGSASMSMGWLWSYWLPLNRHLWTSSMVLWAGGFGFLMVALFYAVIDVAGVKRWTFPLVVIGANALLAYILDPAFERTSNVLVAILVKLHPAAHLALDLLCPFIEVTLLWLILWYLYRKRIFLRA